MQKSDLEYGPRHFSVSSAYSRKRGARAIWLYISGAGTSERAFKWYNVKQVVGNASRRLAQEMWDMVDEAITASLKSGHPEESLRADREALWRQCFVVYVLTAARARTEARRARRV